MMMAVTVKRLQKIHVETYEDITSTSQQLTSRNNCRQDAHSRTQ